LSRHLVAQLRDHVVELRLGEWLGRLDALGCREWLNDSALGAIVSTCQMSLLRMRLWSARTPEQQA
jgi:hypothetical protein